MTEPVSEVEGLEQAIAALEERRDELGDAVVDTAVGPLRQRLAELTTSQRSRRRQVTVLFADVKGYTTLVENLDPEQVGAFVDRLWGELGAIVVAHGGRVVQHLGDGVMALWGGERSQEDDAERAVRAGLQLIDALAGIAVDGVEAELQMRVGVNTGLVHLGHVGVTEEFRATGDTVNVASRLESNAEPGTLLISRTTYHQVRGVFDVTHVGDLALKGRSEAVAAYRVDSLRPRAFRVRARGVEGLETRMVGRGSHLARITSAHAQTMESGHPRLLVVLGEPGIGKSRLLYEYRDWIETESTTRVRWYEGRCAPDTPDRPLGLIRDLLARRFEISDDDDPETVDRKLADGLADLVDDPGHLVATLGWVLGFGPSLGEADREGVQMRRTLALGDLVETLVHLAGDERAVVVLDDLHWIDPGSLEVLERVLAERPPGLVFVATARPVFGESHPAWVRQGGLGDLHEVLALSPLGPRDVGELVSNIMRYADRVPDQLVERVVDESDGNPLHVEELIKILIDDGIVTTGPTWSVDVDRLSEHRTPDTLTGVLQARLDHLPLAQFRALQRASVFGRTFWTDAVASLGDDDVEDALAGLVAAELVYTRSPSRFGHTSELAFTHEFVRVVTYETVALAERPDLHRRAAAWLEEHSGVRPGEHALAIARHYDEAGDRDEAFRWFGRAARHAEHQSAYSDAVRLWQQVVERAPTDEDRATATVSLSYALVISGEFEQAKSLLLELSELPASGGSSGVSTQMLVRSELARIAMFRDGDLELAQRLLEEGLEMATGDETVTAELMLRHQRGNLSIVLGNHAEAARIHEENVARAGEGGELYRRGWGLNSLSDALAHSGELDRASAVADQVIRVSDELGDPRLRMGGIAHKGLVALYRSEWIEALAYFGEAQDLNRRNGDPEKFATVANYLGEAALGIGDVSRAAAEFMEALTIGRRAGIATEQLRACAGLSAIAAEHGDHELAEEGIAMVYAGRAVSEARRLARVVCERYGLEQREPEREADDVVAELERVATGLVATRI